MRLPKYVKKRKGFQDWGKFIQDGKEVNKDKLKKKDFISEEISAGNLELFLKDGVPYIVVKAGYDKDGNLKKYSLAKGKRKVKDNDDLEDLKTETAPAETYEELGRNTAIEKEKELYSVSEVGNKIAYSSELLKFGDNKKFKKEPKDGETYTEDNKKTTNIAIVGTVLSKKRMEKLIEGYYVEDKEGGKKRHVKAIPLYDYKKYIEEKQHPWIEKIIKEYERLENGENSLKNLTEKHIEEVKKRLLKLYELKNKKS